MLINDISDSGSADMVFGYENNGGYEVYARCRNYSPRGGAGVMSMSDYSMCGSCRHQRMDERCGITEKTLA